MLVRWLRTVFSLMNSLRAMSPLASPCATSRRIAFSRAVSSGRSPRWGESGARFARAEEVGERFAEALPRRLGLDEDVVAALQRHEVRAGNFRGEQPALLERNARVAARVHDQRRHSHARQQRTHVDLAERFENARRDFRLRRGAHQVAEPAHLLGVRVRNEQRCEQLAERRIFLAPALADQLVQRLAVAARFVAALRPALGVAAIQHELRDALRMAHGIFDAGRAALRDARAAESGRGPTPRRWLRDLRPAPRAKDRRAFQSDRPQPRGSKRISWRPAERKRNQCRHTGLCQSNSRCDSQFADLTSGAPLPEVATARRTPSADLMNRIVCCIEDTGMRWRGLRAGRQEYNFGVLRWRAAPSRPAVLQPAPPGTGRRSGRSCRPRRCPWR